MLEPSVLEPSVPTGADGLDLPALQRGGTKIWSVGEAKARTFIPAGANCVRIDGVFLIYAVVVLRVTRLDGFCRGWIRLWRSIGTDWNWRSLRRTRRTHPVDPHNHHIFTRPYIGAETRQPSVDGPPGSTGG